ncbi:MAG TPA: hypothetical protein VLC08_15615 [Chitinolyticbacter sp.]|nr:hypothetical protein [Chitinolyticbacter sp.]
MGIDGFTVLTGPAATDLKTLELLLAKGANPYARTWVGSTPLHFVCGDVISETKKTDPDAAKRIALLLKAGTSIDAHYPQKQPHPVATPLGEALISKNPDCVRALLAAGAKPDALMYPESFAKADPSVKGKTVRQQARQGLKENPNLYSKAVVDLVK